MRRAFTLIEMVISIALGSMVLLGAATAFRAASATAALVNGLGYYAGCEYLPPNQIYQYCQSYAAGVTTNGGILRDLVVPGGRFANTDPGVTGFCRGLYLQTFMTAYAVIAPTASDPAAL